MKTKNTKTAAAKKAASMELDGKQMTAKQVALLAKAEKMKAAEVAEVAKTESTKESKDFVHSASMRAEWQANKGVGLNAGACYVSRHIKTGALESTALAVSEGKLVFSKEQSVCIVSGKKGTTARFCYVSTCGKFIQVLGLMGGKGVLSVDIFGEHGTLEIMSKADFARRVSKGAAFTFKRTADEQEFCGRILRNSVDSLIIGLVYGAKGKVMIVDIETDRNNAYNEAVRGFVSGENTDKLTATDKALAALIAG